MAAGTVALTPITAFEHPEQVNDRIRVGLVDCWQDVSNAGGAVGFPFPPVERDEVVAALDTLVARLEPATCRLVHRPGDHRYAPLRGWRVWQLVVTAVNHDLPRAVHRGKPRLITVT